MISAFLIAFVLQFGFGLSAEDPKDFAILMIITVGLTTITWVAVTFLTEPEPEETLIRFYKKVYPSGKLWNPIKSKIYEPFPESKLGRDFIDWIAGCFLIYLSLFGIGKIIFGNIFLGLLLVLLALGAGMIIYWDLNQRGWRVL